MNHRLEIDQPHLEEGHELDVSLIAEAQKRDQLYQGKILELDKQPEKCSYVLEDGVLYKLAKRGMFSQKLLYVPKSMLDQLLKAYHASL